MRGPWWPSGEQVWHLIIPFFAGQTKNPFWKGIWNTWAEYLNKYNSNLLPENKESALCGLTQVFPDTNFFYQTGGKEEYALYQIS